MLLSTCMALDNFSLEGDEISPQNNRHWTSVICKWIRDAT